VYSIPRFFPPSAGLFPNSLSLVVSVFLLRIRSIDCVEVVGVVGGATSPPGYDPESEGFMGSLVVDVDAFSGASQQDCRVTSVLLTADKRRDRGVARDRAADVLNLHPFPPAIRAAIQSSALGLEETGGTSIIDPGA